jgi:hypothetical protein
MSPVSSDTHQLAPKGPAHLSRPCLGHMDPQASGLIDASSPIEKRFVLPPILYAPPLSLIASYNYSQRLLAGPLPSQHHPDSGRPVFAIAKLHAYKCTRVIKK